MSSKGTIFLTSKNEHVYDETMDWSIVFEINKESINKIVIKGYKHNSTETWFQILEDYEYIIIETKENYSLCDSFKYEIREIGTFEPVLNYPSCLYFKKSELKCLETENREFIEYFYVCIYLKEDSEWYKEYYKNLKKSIEKKIEEYKNKLDRCV